MSLGKVLIVDDEKDIVLMVKVILQKAGYTVFTAHNGQAGYDCAVENIPDLIISDILMPKMSGFDLLKKLKENKSTNAIPVILLTQKDSFDDIHKGYELGAGNYLPKPFDSQILLSAVEGVLGEEQE